MNYDKLIEKTREEHLCSVEFLKGTIVLRKQLGNKSGSQIEIEFNESGRIRNIKFMIGHYNEVITLKEEFCKLFDIIACILYTK